MKKSIIVPTDFSSNSEKAFIYAVEFARKLNTSIVLVHAYDLPYPPPGVPASPPKGIEEENLNNLKKMKVKILQLAGDSPLEVDLFTGVGDILSVVENAVERYPSAMIVMGTKGATGLADIILGSNASMLISHSEIPILAIPERAVFKGIHSMLYTTDWTEDDQPILNYLVTLAKPFAAQIEILHILDGTEPFNQTELEQIKEKYPDLVSYAKVKMYLENSVDVTDGINQFIQKHQPDMMVMVARRRNLLGKLFHSSVTQQMALHATIPVLVSKGSQHGL